MKRNIDKVLLTVACAIPFLRLGIGEIQPWDESLYAIRADACLKFGAWLDQTKYAVGGLYSATHPPLGVWLIAISKYLFGDSTFAARLPAALAASASILLLWLIVRRFASTRAAIVASVSLATADLFLTLSHRAQMETLVLFFGLASMYALLIAIQEDRLPLTILSGLFLGLGLLTKFAVALFAAPILLLLPWVLHKPQSFRQSAVSFVIALIISTPWFLMMLSLHSDYLTHVTSSLATLTEGSYAPSKLAWWYYLNRLVVGLPLIAIIVFIRRPSRLYIASLVWLVVIFIGLQFAGTRMPHFAFLLLAPGALLIGAAWDHLKHERESTKSSFILYSSSLIFFLVVIGFSVSEQVRMLLTHHLSWNDLIIPMGGIVAFGIVILLGLLATIYVNTKARSAVGFSVLLLAIAFAHIFSIEERVYQNGAAQVASIVKSLPQKSQMVVIHADYPNEEYAPQLAYYTGGWTLGWLPGKTSRTITTDSAITNVFSVDSSRDIVVIPRFQDRFYHRSVLELSEWNSLMTKLRHSFSDEHDYRSYTLFY